MPLQDRWKCAGKCNWAEDEDDIRSDLGGAPSSDTATVKCTVENVNGLEDTEALWQNYLRRVFVFFKYIFKQYLLNEILLKYLNNIFYSIKYN